MMKNTKGITLVTLVITIIILLILAGVAINTLTQTGLLENAKQAKSIVQNAEKLENQILVNYEKNIGEYITGQRDGSSNKVVLYDNVQGDVSGTLSQSINDFDFIIVTYGSAIDNGIYNSAIINAKYPVAEFEFSLGDTTIFGYIKLDDNKFNLKISYSNETSWNSRYKVYNITGIKY
ncbi:MAG: hypothetical protein ACLUHC_05540 [Clostridia bacterium]